MYSPRWMLIAIAAAVATGGCAIRDPALAPGSGAPAYVPSNAAPPVLSGAANDLVGPIWKWQRTLLASGATVTAGAPERYTLRFQGGGRYLLQADCNSGSGAYEVNGGTMKLGPAALTRMGCPPGSQDGVFGGQLTRVAGYSIVNNELVLTLISGDTMRFAAQP